MSLGRVSTNGGANQNAGVKNWNKTKILGGIGVAGLGVIALSSRILAGEASASLRVPLHGIEILAGIGALSVLFKLAADKKNPDSTKYDNLQLDQLYQLDDLGKLNALKELNAQRNQLEKRNAELEYDVCALKREIGGLRVANEEVKSANKKLRKENERLQDEERESLR